jgi:hypothetical protein
MRINVARMGVDELVFGCVDMGHPLAAAPTIAAGLSNFELIVKPAARADSTLIRSRTRLSSTAN